jgi:hypothetical protein
MMHGQQNIAMKVWIFGGPAEIQTEFLPKINQKALLLEPD